MDALETGRKRSPSGSLYIGLNMWQDVTAEFRERQHQAANDSWMRGVQRGRVAPEQKTSEVGVHVICARLDVTQQRVVTEYGYETKRVARETNRGGGTARRYLRCEEVRSLPHG